MLIVLAGVTGWLSILLLGVALGAAAKRGDALAAAAYGRRPVPDGASAVPRQRRARQTVDSRGVQRRRGPARLCPRCGARR